MVSNTNQPVIEVSQLTKRYGNTIAVDDITFAVDQGEIVGFLGPNGAGKSTTMRILTCFMPASEGNASVMSFDTFRQSQDVRRSVGYMPEGVPLYPEMRVTEYLRFRSAIKGVPRRDRKQRVGEVIERCDISSVRRKLIGQLSKGYRQRVGLADALVADPPILILDEPTIGLDPNQIRSVRKLIRELGEKHTILLSTHILPEVEATCSRVLVINQGRIVFTESLEAIRKQGAEDAPIKVEVRGPEKQVQNVLTGITGVERVKCDGQEDDVVALTVKTKAGADVREEIFQRVAKNGWSLRELRREAVTLEDIFVRITAGDTPEETTS